MSVRLCFRLTHPPDVVYVCTEEQRDRVLRRMECGFMLELEREDGSHLHINPRHVVHILEETCAEQ